MKKSAFYFATTGWVVSLIIHLNSWTGQDLISSYPAIWLLHVGALGVWFSVVLLMRNDGIRGLPNGPKKMRPFSYLAALGHCPRWIVVLAIAGIMYAIFNLALYIISGPASAEIQDGRYVMAPHGRFIRFLSGEEYHHIKAVMLRSYSGFWIAFYGMAAAILFPYPRTSDPRSPGAGSVVGGAPGGVKVIVYVALGLFLGSSGCAHSESHAKTLARAKAKQLSQAATMAAFHDRDYKKAILLLDSATKIDSNYLFAYSSKLICQLTLNRFDDALGTAKNMNRIQPESPDYYVTVGILYDKKGDSGMAKTYYENAAVHYNKILDTMRIGNKARGILLMNCGIDLILAGRKQQGEDILSRLYAGETEPAFKEVLASYMNKSRQAILDSLTQGQHASSSVSASVPASVPASAQAKKD